MAILDRYLEIAAQTRASDIHFAADEPVRMRVDGDLTTVGEDRMSTEGLEKMMFEICTDYEKEKCEKNRNLDKSYAVEGIGFFRVNIFYTRRGMSAVLRTIPQKIPTMEQLGLPESIRKLAEAAKGLVLVTGPTGSGKSTTLAAMIDYINSNFPYHILTAEDPVEFVHPSKKCLVNQREIGSSCHTFSDALKYALREDPDVILVGEMRDLETISLALTAAETGHLVFGTLHTRGAGASVDRIIDSFPANQQAMIRAMLSESLVGVVSQSLLKRCDKPGRVAALEILIVNHAVSNLIREGKTFQLPSIMQTARRDGMVLMDAYILDLVDKGIVDPVEALPYMENPQMLANKKSKVQPQAAAAQAVKAPATPPQAPPSAPPAAPSAPSAAAPTPPPVQAAPTLKAVPPLTNSQLKPLTATPSPPAPKAVATPAPIPPPAKAAAPPVATPTPAAKLPMERSMPATPPKPRAVPTPPPKTEVKSEELEEEQHELTIAGNEPTFEPLDESDSQSAPFSETVAEGSSLSEDEEDRIGTIPGVDTIHEIGETTGIFALAKDEYGEEGTDERVVAESVMEEEAPPRPTPAAAAPKPIPPRPTTAAAPPPPRPVAPPPVASTPKPPAPPAEGKNSFLPPPPPKRKVG